MKDIFNGNIKETKAALISLVLFSIIMFIGGVIFFTGIFYDKCEPGARVLLFILTLICFLAAIFNPVAAIYFIRRMNKYPHISRIFFNDYLYADQKILHKGDLILLLKPMFEKAGFNKAKATWSKSKDDLIYVFNIQSSLHGAEYYINVGIYIKALGVEEKRLEYHCHIRSRINIENPFEEIFSNAIDWFKTYGCIENLKNLYSENQLPLTTTMDTKKYLSDLINSELN